MNLASWDKLFVGQRGAQKPM